MRALTAWAKENPGLAKKFRTAINRSLVYAQAHPDEIRRLLPAGTGTCACRSGAGAHRPGEAAADSPTYARDFGVITKLPNLIAARPA